MRRLVIAALLCCSTPALADGDAGDGIIVAADGGPRTGWIYGAEVGRGRLDLGCPNCSDLAPLEDALSIGGHVGKMITPRLALVADLWMVRYQGRDNYWFGDSEDHTVSQQLLTGAAQLWLGRRLWVRAGAGVGHHRSDVRYVDVAGGARLAAAGGGSMRPARNALATTVAAGLEIIHTRAIAVDLVLRGGHSRGEGVEATTGAFAFGVSWY